MDLSICILARNEELCIERLLKSIQPHAEEIIIVNDHSTDSTKEISLRYTDKVIDYPYSVKESGLGEAKSWMIEHATKEWILVLDADELMPDIHLIAPLMRYPNKNIWCLPRRKWINYNKKQREEYDKYPDWQIRLFKNHQGYKYIGQMHEHFSGTPAFYAYRGPHIEHLQAECRPGTPFKVDLYKELADRQGVSVVGGNIIPG